jgi:hypothetical protein
MDYLKLCLCIGIAAMLAAIACLFLVAFANSGSRNIPLALGTVFGALLLLSIQMMFELRSTKSQTAFSTEFTTDTQDHKIVAYRYKPGGPMLRATNELEANKYLRNTNIQAFDDNEKLWKDMSLFSLVAYFWTEQHDWQITRENLNSSNSPFQTFQFLSKSDDRAQCAKVDFTAVQKMLRGTHNVFAEFKPVGLPFEYMCLPPNSTIVIEPEHVLIRNPFCAINFAVQQMPSMQLNARPRMADTLLPDKRPRFETRTGVIRVTVKYDWIRAQSRDMPKYQTWANDVVERARLWFENGTPEGGIRFADGIE